MIFIGYITDDTLRLSIKSMSKKVHMKQNQVNLYDHGEYLLGRHPKVMPSRDPFPSLQCDRHQKWQLKSFNHWMNSFLNTHVR